MGINNSSNNTKGNSSKTAIGTLSAGIAWYLVSNLCFRGVPVNCRTLHHKLQAGSIFNLGGSQRVQSAQTKRVLGDSCQSSDTTTRLVGPSSLIDPFITAWGKTPTPSPSPKELGNRANPAPTTTLHCAAPAGLCPIFVTADNSRAVRPPKSGKFNSPFRS